MKEHTKVRQPATPYRRRLYGYGLAGLLLVVLMGLGALSTSLHYVYRYAAPEVSSLASDDDALLRTFPLGVDPDAKTITENPTVDAFFYTELSNTRPDENNTFSFLEPVIGKLALFSWYQNLASAQTRILVIEPGERKEQVATHFGKILGWTDDERREFLATVISFDPVLLEGKFSPGKYVVARDAKPSEVAALVTERFTETVLSRYPAGIEKVVPLSDTLIIASLLEREAYDFEDMRYIAGVIWNRLFIDMKLQIDATLQYAKGEKSQKTWWPRVIPEDKYIDSEFNTYKHKGLPPAPIANPSANAILAALNPRQTECIYYFHDKKGGFHCSVTYEDHVASLKEYYGRGK
jgi:cell division protein YceG involved in septum cleavage